MSKKDLHEIPDEEFVKLVKEFISDVGIEKMSILQFSKI